MATGNRVFRLDIGTATKHEKDRHNKKEGNLAAAQDLKECEVFLNALTINEHGDIMFEVKDVVGACYCFKILKERNKVWFMGAAFTDEESL
jgi:hypothetical protein